MPPSPSTAIPLQDQPWRRSPGIHQILLGGLPVWVRVDARGVAAMSTRGPDALAPKPS
jgi:hypothetical protein